MDSRIQWPRNQEFASWCTRMQGRIARFSPELKVHYSRGETLGHFLRVADALDISKDRITLARAGFLHGVPSDVLRQILPSHDQKPILDILGGWEKLVSLDCHSSSIAHHLEANVLPTIHPDAALLFLVAQLDHLDPDGRLGRWTRDFCIEAGHAPEVLPFVPLDMLPVSCAGGPNFVRHVTARSAKFWGLWAEHNLFENAALYRQDNSLFGRICEFAVKCHEPGGKCEEFVDRIRQTLTTARASSLGKALEWNHNGYDVNPRWEWRHTAALAARLDPAKSEKDWELNLHRCGYVTLTCPDEASCYALLGYLHKLCHYRKDTMRDYLGKGDHLRGVASSVYKALHTVLVQDEQSIMVRLIPEKYAQERFQSPSREYFMQLAGHLATESSFSLRVYTPYGKMVDLPPGSTVLNFACKIHSTLVAFVEKAILNKKDEVDILHPLKQGDEVELVKSEEVQALPAGWEEKVPQTTVRGIKLRYNKARRDNREAYYKVRGRAWLVARLQERGYDVLSSDSYLDDLLITAARRYEPVRKEVEEPWHHWWLCQMGLLEECVRSGKRYAEAHIDQGHANRFVRTVIRLLEEKYRIYCELDLDETARESMAGLCKCEECNPDSAGEVAVTQFKGNLVVHRRDAPCAVGGKLVRWARRILQNQYFVVETTNRMGVTADILRVFKEEGIDLSEVSGLKLGPGWGVVRVEAERVSRSKVEAVKQKLAGVEGVSSRVSGPYDPPNPVLESFLSSRRSRANLTWSSPDPYITGPPILDEAYFYGRSRDLAELMQILKLTCAQAPYAHSTVFVGGPFKTGKSSLVLHFLDKARDYTEPSCLQAAYVEAARTHTWQDVEKALKERLIFDIHRTMAVCNASLPASIPAEATLVECIEWLKRERKDAVVVLAVDEATALFSNVQKDSEQIKALETFLAGLRGLDRVLLIWIGPRAPVARLDPGMQLILRAAHQVELLPFNREEARDLLRAVKLFPMVHVDIAVGLARQANRYTGGNPYWLSRLGELMWRQIHWKKGMVHYTHKMLQKAKTDILVERDKFIDRIRFKGQGVKDAYLCGNKDCLQWTILCVLASDEEQDRDAMPQEELLRKLKSTCGAMDDSQMEEALSELVAWGSLKQTTDGKSLRWELAAPILRDFIRLELVKPIDTSVDPGDAKGLHD